MIWFLCIDTWHFTILSVPSLASIFCFSNFPRHWFTFIHTHNNNHTIFEKPFFHFFFFTRGGLTEGSIALRNLPGERNALLLRASRRCNLSLSALPGRVRRRLTENTWPSSPASPPARPLAYLFPAYQPRTCTFSHAIYPCALVPVSQPSFLFVFAFFLCFSFVSRCLPPSVSVCLSVFLFLSISFAPVGLSFFYSVIL